jgi:hypothetical protein
VAEGASSHRANKGDINWFRRHSMCLISATCGQNQWNKPTEVTAEHKPEVTD